MDGSRVTGAVARTADGGRRRIAAGLVVGADGVRSTVARLTGVERPVRFPRRLGLVAHYAGDPELVDHGEMHVGRGYYVGLAPLPDGQLNVGMALPMDGRSARRRTASRPRSPGSRPWPAACAGRERLTLDPRRLADRPSRRGRRRAGVAAGRRRRRLRRSVHRRGDPPRPAIGPGRGRGHRHRRRPRTRLPPRATSGVRGEVRPQLAGPGLPRRAAAPRARSRPPRRATRRRAAARLRARRPAGPRPTPSRPARSSRSSAREEPDPRAHARAVRARLRARRGRRALAGAAPPLPIRPPHPRRRAPLRDGRASRPDPRSLGAIQRPMPERRTIEFIHTGGVTRGMEVAWRFEDRGDGAAT